jgi:hypothetical protein
MCVVVAIYKDVRTRGPIRHATAVPYYECDLPHFSLADKFARHNNVEFQNWTFIRGSAKDKPRRQ